ncbi:hypothetical protein RIF29_28533 [Crotalaria pallida]|uniref:Uncharacterized protein n=1 Tax=Crotalaria pallida TaxID=3830 RepID=A0AAN9HWL3_CROPI
MDRTVSRRSEPSSRTALMGEQPNPWNLLQPQVAKSRHRETALPLGTVGSLRPTFVPARQVGLAVKLPSALALEGQSPSGLRKPLHTSVTFWEAYVGVIYPPLPFGRPADPLDSGYPCGSETGLGLDIHERGGSG